MHGQGSRLLGLNGVVVTDVCDVGDQLDLQVELIARAGDCPRCGRVCGKVKERPVVAMRDLPIGGRRTVLRWRKRRYWCPSCRRSFTEAHPELPARQRVTERFRRRLRSRVTGGAAHAEVARDEQTTRYQVACAFRCAADDDYVRRHGARFPRRLSLDEAHHRRGRELATVVSDLDRRCVVDVIDGCTRRSVERYLRTLTDPQRQSVEVVSIDPSEAYRQAIRSQLPDARIVCDHFHLVRGANTALDSIRRERQRQHARRRPKGTRRSGRLDTWNPELYRARHRLLKASERLTERERRRLCELFERDPILAQAWGLKEAFRAIYRSADREQATHRLEQFLTAVDQAGLPAFDAFAKGIRRWREELLAYFDEPTTNGYAEGVINKVKVIKRRAYGIPTFDAFRQRVLLACG
jgi:transposase